MALGFVFLFLLINKFKNGNNREQASDDDRRGYQANKKTDGTRKL
jgi:hypothetical protein